mmetsp:Transcript_14291/g.40572  ORF Transcript_14291/g.40572 Transcript_14291/m.40572 type:complete len:204 (-) Transcript_14291:1687-2298(-)
MAGTVHRGDREGEPEGGFRQEGLLPSLPGCGHHRFVLQRLLQQYPLAALSLYCPAAGGHALGDRDGAGSVRGLQEGQRGVHEGRDVAVPGRGHSLGPRLPSDALACFAQGGDAGHEGGLVPPHTLPLLGDLQDFAPKRRHLDGRVEGGPRGIPHLRLRQALCLVLLQDSWTGGHLGRDRERSHGNDHEGGRLSHRDRPGQVDQ